MLSQSLDLLFLGGDVSQALLQTGDFAEPLHPLGFPETFAGVALDLQKSGFLGQVQAEHGTSDASVFMLARGSVGAVAGAEGDFAETEVVTEFLPFGVTRFAALLAGAVGPALVDELPVVADDLLGIDRDVCLGRVEIEVAE
ncbi:hypothetical protein ACFYWX_43305 [Streptomyces sp. NPDC002888]|uniref:hypothetical protein n=1 Tax=Streptomyces sp. NPDC002888 TaxID=3364668 RepID=UPI0036D0E775